MGSDKSHFNVSLIVRDKVTRQCPQTTTFEEKGEPQQIRTEVLLLTSLTPYHKAKPAHTRSILHCCLTSTEARWPIRDGDRVGRGRESERLDRGNRPKKTGETADRHQNNRSVKAVSPRHCPATCALRSCSFNCCAGQSTKTMCVAPLLT